MLKVNRHFVARSLLIACAIGGVTKGSATAQEQSAETAAYDQVAPVYATINWPDPLNPEFIPLGGGGFLVGTIAGLQHWDANRNVFSPIPHGPTHLHLLKHVWVRINDGLPGTLFAIRGSLSEQNVTLAHSLLWWSWTKQAITASLPLPDGFQPRALVEVWGGHVLVCGVGASAFLVHADGTGIKRVATDGQNHLRSWLKPRSLPLANIVGPVEGLGEFGAARDQAERSQPPIQFDTRSCKWTMTNPPKALPPGKELRIKPYSLPSLLTPRLVIGQAEWFSIVKNHWETLDTPLLWNARNGSWETIERVAEEGGSPGSVSGFGADDPVVNMFHPAPRWIEFLDPVSLRWRRSRERLPEAYNALLAPLDGNRVVAFMGDSGQVVLLHAMDVPTPPGKLNFEHDTFSEIPLANGGLMLVSGGSDWHPLNRPEVIQYEGQSSRLITPLPRPLVTPSGIALGDGSVLVFGGLPPQCSAEYLNQCKGEMPLPSFRWFPTGDRWEEVTGLAIPFASGAYPDSDNSRIADQWARSDALVRGNGEFVYLTDGEVRRRDTDNQLPLVTKLYRWSPGRPQDLIAPLRKGRQRATLLELADGRLAVVGGLAQREIVALEKDCFECPDTFVSLGPLEAARSTEIYEEQTGRWVAGVSTQQPGGRAVKLANGHIFKLSLKGITSDEGYQAETADAALSRWAKAPPFPIEKAAVRQFIAVGNRAVLLLAEPRDKLVLWNDDTRRWSVMQLWPGTRWSVNNRPISIMPVGDQHVLLRYADTYEYAALPE